VKFGQPNKLLRDLSHVALARHELLSHPAEPLRLAQIVANVHRLTDDVISGQIVKYFFENNQTLVNQFIHSILLA
jgi:hypothetical protein